MQIVRTIVTGSLVMGLTLLNGACSSGSSDPEVDPTPSASASQGSSAFDASPDGSGTADLGASCEEFNTLMSDVRGTDSADSDAFDDIYLRSEKAKKTAPDETFGLFAAVSLLALEKGSGDEVEQETADALRDATFAAAGPCTAEGVTLTL